MATSWTVQGRGLLAVKIQISESAVRKLAKRRLWSLHKANRWSRKYYLADSQNYLKYENLSLEDAAAILHKLKPAVRGLHYF